MDSRSTFSASSGAIALLAATASLLLNNPASAHGFAGKRFFPATLAIEDPFVADELSLPTISRRKDGDTRETNFAVDMSKRITENFGIGIGATYKELRPDEGQNQRGFDNVSASFKYQFYQNDEHETIVSAGADWDIGNSGSKRVGAESFSTVTPSVFFGKGFGDLPAEMKFLRPLAIAGAVGIGIPSRSSTRTVNGDGDVDVERHPHVLKWGIALEYSLPYLQSFVQDVGLRGPFNRMIPVVEFPMSTALDRGASGTTGTVNPGIIWAGTYVQLTVEAVIPINKASGSHTGWIAQVHFYLDDLFPNTLGRPIVR